MDKFDSSGVKSVKQAQKAVCKMACLGTSSRTDIRQGSAAWYKAVLARLFRLARALELRDQLGRKRQNNRIL
jgi:hypothetical protein